jgi:digeranylgeranylglycerophospholipid reductase
MYDVIVIGGGPSGSYAARRLAEKGHKTLVLEKQPSAGHKSCCTGIIGRECAVTFGIDDRVIIRNANSATLFPPSGNGLYIYREEPQACILDRAAFDVSMADRAQRAGVELGYGSRVTGISYEKKHVNVSVSHGKKEIVMPAKAVIVASGFTPGLNGRLGLGVYKDFTIGVQAEVEAPGLKEVEVYFGDMAPGFFAWLVPTANNIARAGLLSRKGAGIKLKKWLTGLADKGKITTADVKIHYGGIPLKPPSRSYGDRLIAVGDAAGQVKPTSGGGIYYGLIGAEIAADTLHQALEDNDLSAGRLAEYERAWRKKLGKEIRTGYWARKLFERLSNQQIDSLFKLIKAGGIDEALLKAEDVSFDWHGKTIMKLLKYRIVVKTLNIIRLPFKNG